MKPRRAAEHFRFCSGVGGKARGCEEAEGGQGQKEGGRVEATEIYWERKLENGTRPVATGWGRGIVRFPI